MKQKLINEFAKKALKYLDSAEAFASKEVPAYIDELLQFKFWEHVVNGVTKVGVV